jgi:hypothetical protein
MSDNKMFNKMASTPWKLVELPGGHNWSIIEEESDIHLANVGDDRTSHKAGYLAGNAILKNAEAIVLAVNNTFGAGINPEAVPELLKALEELSGFCERHFTTAKAGWISRREAIKVIEKSKII